MSTDLADALVIWANGWLAAAYWTWDSAALLLTIGIAILITIRYDREVRRTAGERVRRYGRGQVIIASRRSLYETLAHLAKSEKGFTDEEYKRFVSRMPSLHLRREYEPHKTARTVIAVRALI